jgi:anti-anti-sigma factor
METATKLIDVEQLGDTLVLTPHGNLLELDLLEFGDEPEELLQRVTDDRSIRNVVLDFGQTEYLGSTALGLFARLGHKVSRRNGRLALCNLSARPDEVLEITGFVNAWPVYHSREEALAAVG